MAQKNITIKDFNGSNWDTLYPKTTASQVITDTDKQFSTEAEKIKLADIEVGANKYTHPSTHPATMITGLATVATTGSYNDLTNKPTIPTVGTVATRNTGTTSGTIPIIGTDDKLDASIIPAIAISDTFVVSNQTAMLALTAQVGDVAVRTDLNKSFILKTEGTGTLANWQELLTPSSPVQSVAGKTGAVTLTKADVGLGNVDNTSDANKPISSAAQTALNAKAPLASPTFTGTPSAPTAVKGTNTTQLATTAFVQTSLADVTSALGTKIIVSASQPTGANVGDLWYEVEV